MQKAKWLSEEVLQIAEKRREGKGKGEKESYTQLNAEFQRMQGEIILFLFLFWLLHKACGILVP